MARKKSCFLNIAYTAGIARLSRTERIITDYFKSKGFKVRTGREANVLGKERSQELKRIIKECDFGVVVYNVIRRNIDYELGLIDALDKDVILFVNIDLGGDIAKDFSDKSNVTWVSYSGDQERVEIEKQLENNEGLKTAIETLKKKKEVE